ncbi:DUF1294 domain-containing protein [Rubritalea sp.]|uniref:DUF1294 domain-containing protein n=1 Tax=Rubritalea sp. TaxID=2109375 RepID=UPI003F4AC0A4
MPNNTPTVDSEILTAKIAEWDHQKGFGFLKHNKQKLFLHHKDFAEKHKRPDVGDRVHYKLGSDKRGRACAIEAVHVNDGGKLTPTAILTLFCLLVLPLLVANRLALGSDEPTTYFLIGLAIFLSINLFTYKAYKDDKQRARAKEWRVSEGTLHFLSLIGGWPAAFLAQRKLRHKCSKLNFQFTYKLTVALYLYLSLDYLLHWSLLRTLLLAVKSLSES